MGCCASNVNSVTLSSKLDTNTNGPQLAFVRQMSNIREYYTIVRCLGSGNFGSCYLIRDKRSGVERMAKELIKSLINQNVTEKLALELNIIKELDHPCISKIFEVIETSTRIYVITEYLTGGILYEKYSESEKINEKLAAKYFIDIILSLYCIHKLKIVHRDLKPTNLLFESNAPDAHLKLIDFGISILQQKQAFYTDSVQYMAPEVINNSACLKSDIWSAGVILYTMLSGALPFSEDSHERTAQAILHNQLTYESHAWSDISPEALSLVQRMLSKNIKDRPSAELILSDPWLMAYNRNTLPESTFRREICEKLSILNASINLEKSIFSFISNQVLSSKDLKKLKDMFRSLDKDGSGTLSIAELNSGYDSIGLPPPASIVEMVKKLDADGSGTIDYFEFLKGSEDWTKIHMKKELDLAAKKYEKGSVAKISLEELKGTIPDIKGNEWMDWLSAADKNGDGYITLDELSSYLSRKLGL